MKSESNSQFQAIARWNDFISDEFMLEYNVLREKTQLEKPDDMGCGSIRLLLPKSDSGGFLF